MAAVLAAAVVTAGVTSLAVLMVIDVYKRQGLASKQHVSRMENGERSCSIDLLIELSCILNALSLIHI